MKFLYEAVYQVWTVLTSFGQELQVQWNKICALLHSTETEQDQFLNSAGRFDIC